MNLTQLYTDMLNNPNKQEPTQEQNETEIVSENCNVVEKPKKKLVKGNKNSMKKTKPQLKKESFDSLFQSILHEADEFQNFEAEGEEDFDSGFEDDGAIDDVDVGGDDTVTVSKSALEDLRAQLDALISGGGVDDDFEDFTYDDGGDEDFDDDIPKESRWDGTLSPANKTNLVKDNGDVNFDQELDFEPSIDNDGPTQTDGPKGTFDGKLSRQKDTDHVKGNGDANFGKVRTNFKRTDKTGKRLFGKGK